MGYKLTTVAACRVVNLDRQRLNEFIANGDYTCAPDTSPGRARLFTEDDLIALFVFAREVERGMKPLIAGRLAQNVRETLSERPGAETAKTVGRIVGPHFERTGPTITASSDVGRLIFNVIEYNLAGIRKLVAEGVEEERQIIGPEDE